MSSDESGEAVQQSGTANNDEDNAVDLASEGWRRKRTRNILIQVDGCRTIIRYLASTLNLQKVVDEPQ